jgi:choice-of-anchor B domain-containing protein
VGQPGEDSEPLSDVRCVDGRAAHYACQRVDVLAVLPKRELGVGPTATVNDVWGWTDPQTGVEHALVGTSEGTAFVSLADPTRPRLLGNLPTRTLAAPWRDIKVYRDHALIVADVVGHGMQVFDLTRLRGVTSPATFRADAEYHGPGLGASGGFALGNAHNLAVDEATGFAYLVGSSTCDGGLHMVDVRDPRRPAFAGCFRATGYVHDSQCVVYRGPDAAHAGREVCFDSNAGRSSLGIVDVTDKRAPRHLSETGYDGNYAHQGWLTEDQRHFLLGDELDELRRGQRTRTWIFDVSDLDAPRLVGVHEGPSGSIDHNLYVRGSLAFQANYTRGLAILDLSRVAQGDLAEVAAFDLVPGSDEPIFDGAWSVYPWFASGAVLVSGISNGLFVLRPRAAAAARPGPGPGELGPAGAGRPRSRRERPEAPGGRGGGGRHLPR